MTLIRKRYIPDEVIDISSDEILYLDDELLVSKWVPIHKREDIKEGIAYLYIKRGFKIAKIYNQKGDLDHYYCDIMQVEVDDEKKVYTEIDLLVDVVVYPDGKIKVVDLDELVDARRNGLITETQLLYALSCASDLLNIIYDGKFEMLCEKKVLERRYYIDKKADN
ncbi:MAG TPA: DUF402 domain-containing protein [Clostridiales bacterium]|nr:DUF402 domain-containing protein [Clostridiales bacterium]